MGFHFHFRGMQDSKDLKDLVNFIAKQDLKYPNYDEWVQRTESELCTGWKHAILAFSEAHLVGDLIFQQHKQNPAFLELKNLRIHPLMRDRYFARFMVRQMEFENRGKYNAVICDAPADQPELFRFMESQGYSPLLTLPLYDKNSPDVAMLKFLDERKKQLILSSAKKIIFDKAV